MSSDDSLTGKIEWLMNDALTGNIVRLIVFFETPSGITGHVVHEADPVMLIDSSIRLQMLLMDRLREQRSAGISGNGG